MKKICVIMLFLLPFSLLGCATPDHLKIQKKYFLEDYGEVRVYHGNEEKIYLYIGNKNKEKINVEKYRQ